MNAAPVCTMAPYKTRPEAARVKAHLLRESSFITKVYLCPLCDCYHVEGILEQRMFGQDVRDPRNWRNGPVVQLVNMIAQGWTCDGAARELRITEKSADKIMHQLRGRFYALNTPHLISILIALGIIRPLLFVRGITEKTHAV